MGKGRPMNFSTRYSHLTLDNPLVVGASPFADSVSLAQEVQDAGAAALIMRSLFQEQIYLHHLTRADAPGGQLPASSEYQLSPEAYLRQIAKLKAALRIPIVASLNGCQPGGWIDYACRFQEAGADAIELNLYQVAADSRVSAGEVEAELLETFLQVKAAVAIPVSVKLSPFHTAPAHFARSLVEHGAAGIALFNRFYQPELDLETGEETTGIRLSDPSELPLRLRWGAIFAGQVPGSLAITGGVERGQDVVRCLLVGAHAVQVVSALLKHGPHFLGVLLGGLRQWMERHHYGSVEDFRGSLATHPGSDQEMAERAGYQRVLQLWKA